MRPPATVVLLAGLFLASFAVPARAQLSVLETADLRLIYFSPSESYLAPHVARCFENSLRFQRRLFEYPPAEKVTVLLNDFADFGNASAGVTPKTTSSCRSHR